MNSKYRNLFKSSDTRSFLFFLLLTSCIAALIKLSKEYVTSYEIPIQITDIPIDKTINKVSPERISFKAVQSGFSLLANSITGKKLLISFTSLDSVTNSKYEISTAQLLPTLEKSISSNGAFSNFSTQLIKIEMDELAHKKVPVIATVSLDFKGGYNTQGAAVISPDSVKVVGALGLLDKINSVRTKKERITDIDQDLITDLVLDTLALYKEVKLSHTRFEYTQKVAKFTEGSFAIPVTIRGAREDVIKIFPKEVTLFFVASLSDYDDILPTDFEVMANFSTSTKDDEYVVLAVSRQPENVRNVRLETKQVKFLVVN